MPTPRIYHYTSVESLALILKTGTIRFSRLDRVDDVREAQRHIGIDFGKFFFVSCWTLDDLESIPQWSMYSDQMRGVRLEFPAYPFNSDPLRPPPDWAGIDIQGDIPSPLSFQALWGPSYFIVPIFVNPDHFAGTMNYVEDVEAVYTHSIRREIDLKARTQRVQIQSLPLLPRHKSVDWKFQKEYRFSLLVLPSLPLPPTGPDPQFSANIDRHISQSFLDNVDPGINYLDVPLSPRALNDLIVRTGPLMSPGNETCVAALLSQFAPKAQVERSALAGAIRPKGA